MPLRAARHTCRFEIGSLVANWAAHCRKPEAICAALDRRLVQAAKIALARAITDRMAVDAPRMRQHLAERCFTPEIEEKLSGDANPFDAFSEAP